MKTTSFFLFGLMTITGSLAAPVDSESPNTGLWERQSGKTCSTSFAADSVVTNVTAVEGLSDGNKTIESRQSGNAIDGRSGMPTSMEKW
ncbi:hypothetical protein PT974_07091 [Cladobotryum mycophilum]|uniref:Uncharacterized protein n=1 Tax=Cladobotryum mycophilum TaxID=491253 RepID=A0ABR0SN89_9HYPO